MSPAERSARIDAATATPDKTRNAKSDRFAASQTRALVDALAAQPEVRPEVVERGRTLAADPSYPSPAILKKIGAAILHSSDSTESLD